MNERNDNNNGNQLDTNDDRLLQRMVAARLDLSNSQTMLNRNFKLSVIKRCWEDQLRLKSIITFLSDVYLIFFSSRGRFRC